MVEDRDKNNIKDDIKVKIEESEDSLSHEQKNRLVRDIIQGRKDAEYSSTDEEEERRQEKRKKAKDTEENLLNAESDISESDVSSGKKRRKKVFFDEQVRTLSASVLDMVMVNLFIERYGEKVFFLRRFLGDIRMKEFVYMFEGETIQIPTLSDYNNFLISVDVIVYLLANPDGENSVIHINRIAKKHGVSKEKIIEEIKYVKDQVSRLREKIILFE